MMAEHKLTQLKLGTYFIILYKEIYFVVNNTKMSDFALIHKSSN